jgi:homoaconitate hydratase
MVVTDPAWYLDQIDFNLFDAYREWTYLDKTHETKNTITSTDENIKGLYTVTTPQPILVSASSVVPNVNPSSSADNDEPNGNPSGSNVPSLSGRVQVFEDNVDTDAIIPAQFMGLNSSSPLWPSDCATEEAFLATKAFAYTRPDFVSKARAGANIIVAGTAFGSGSSREEAARCLKALGIQAVIAKSFAYIYARNQPNHALLGIVIADERFHALAVEDSEVVVNLSERYVEVKQERFPFQLTALEESFLHGGGLQMLFRRYKKDLFRMAMQERSKDASARSATCTSSGSCENTAQTSIMTEW